MNSIISIISNEPSETGMQEFSTGFTAPVAKRRVENIFLSSCNSYRLMPDISRAVTR
jgi:hypothetical protein